jgi:predicted DNA-binding protein (UPF0251 family)
MKNRGRPKKIKVIEKAPEISSFSPRGKPGRPDEVEISLEEFEALRLSDYLGQSQTQASASMAISQQTFSRIIKKARKAVAEALVRGKRIMIHGGSFYLTKDQPNPPKK